MTADATALETPPARGILVRRLGFALLLGMLLLPVVFILYYAISMSLKSRLDIINPQFQWFFTPTLDNYQAALEQDFLRFIRNSMVVAVASVGIGLVIGLPAAYAIARAKKANLGSVILGAKVTPGIAFLVPYFIVFSKLGWLDTWRALIVTHLVITIPMITWLMIAFFEDLPIELEESAFVDGASRVTTFLRIVLPLAKGGVATVSILAFMASWNNFLFALALAGRKSATLPVAAVRFIQYETINWGSLAAAAIIMALPVAIITLSLQRHLVSGLAIGSVKG